MTTASLGYAAPELDALGAEHTAREIAQQPSLWRETGAITRSNSEEISAFLRPLLAFEDLRIVLTGAGTSAFAGQMLAPALSRELRRRVDAVATTDIVSNPREYFAENKPTLLVSFSRSGNSPESVATTELAEQCLTGVHHLIVTCNAEGELYRRHRTADNSLVLLMPERANDKGFAMTSSVTCMMLATLLALAGSPAAVGDVVERLATAGEQILNQYGAAARQLAERKYERIVYLGSGSLKGLAQESGLKLLELTAGGVVTYFDSALGFRHGPKSVLNEHTLALVYLSNDSYTRQYDVDIAHELRASIGAENVVVVGAGGENTFDGGQWRVEDLDDVDDAFLALPLVLIAQLLALNFSLARGNTPDNPFPSGEVNRVVQGVTIHSLGQC